MWLRLRRGYEGGYRSLATIEDTPENYERMKSTLRRLYSKNVDVRIVRLASLYQDEKLQVTGLSVNRANKRREKKAQRVYDRHIERQNSKLQKYVGDQPMYDPEAVWNMRVPVPIENGIAQGVQELREGNTRPWDEIKAEVEGAGAS